MPTNWNLFLAVIGIGWMIIAVGLYDYLKRPRRSASDKMIIVAPKMAFTEQQWDDFKNDGHFVAPFNANSPRQPEIRIQ
jgi:hypothetical protein